jgi:hypothetical protein
MELESLKYMWKNLETAPIGRVEEDIRAVLRRRSNGLVVRMQRSLLFELVLMILTYVPAILVYIVGFGGRFREMAGLLLFLLFFFGVYFYRKYSLLRQMQCLTCDLRSNLERQVLKLRQYIRFYILAGTAIVPVTALVTWLILSWKSPLLRDSGFYHQLIPLPWWKTFAFWLPAIALATVAVYFLNVWYVNRLYGRHVRKLEVLVREMNES